MPDNVQTRETPAGARSSTRAVPGMGMAVLVAGLAALGFGYWAEASQSAAAATDVVSMAEVAPEDMQGALATVDGNPTQLERFKDPKACNARLAWVVVMRDRGQPAGRLRLQSGNYLSPVFELGEAPVRIALPFPAPYTSGRGTISVMVTTSDAIVALTPPWRVPAQGGAQARQVTWTPDASCPGNNT